MRNSFKSLVLALALALVASAAARADDSPQSESPSLGQLARKVKAEKTKDPKPAKVFTNDNLDVSAPEPSASDKPDKDATTATSPAATPAKAATTASAPHDQEYYRAAMTKLKSQLDTDQRELDVLQQKLGQNQMQYYSDPNKSMQQQYSREDVNKLTDQINAQKDVVAADNKAIDDLRDQLRHEGGDAGWLR